jgi:hypothetical protein
MLRETVKVEGRPPAVSPESTLTILDREAQRSERETAKLTRGAIRDEAPVGPGRGGKHLRDQHRYSVRRTSVGWIAQQTRTADGWYGRIVENGRHSGFSAGHSAGTRNEYGWHYPAARANPYVERAVATVVGVARRLLEAGGERAGRRIQLEVLR